MLKLNRNSGRRYNRPRLDFANINISKSSKLSKTRKTNLFCEHRLDVRPRDSSTLCPCRIAVKTNRRTNHAGNGSCQILRIVYRIRYLYSRRFASRSLPRMGEATIWDFDVSNTRERPVPNAFSFWHRVHLIIFFSLYLSHYICLMKFASWSLPPRCEAGPDRGQRRLEVRPCPPCLLYFYAF